MSRASVTRFVRLNPHLSSDGHPVTWKRGDDTHLEKIEHADETTRRVSDFASPTSPPIDSPRKQIFTFNKVFGEEVVDNASIVHDLKPIVRSVITGKSATVVCCGPPSGGKSRSMIGTKSAEGILQLAIRELFRVKEEHSVRNDVLIKYYCGEVFHEYFVDLITDRRTYFEDFETEELLVSNGWHVATDVDVLLHQLNGAIERRQDGGFETDAARRPTDTVNAHKSTRAHFLVSISVLVSRKKNPEDQHQSTLNFCEVAGPFADLTVSEIDGLIATNEQAKKEAIMKSLAPPGSFKIEEEADLQVNGSIYSRWEETKQVNKGALHFIKALQSLDISSGSPATPRNEFDFHATKITRFLKPALGGQHHLALIVCLQSCDSNISVSDMFVRTCSQVQFAGSSKTGTEIPRIKNPMKIRSANMFRREMTQLQKDISVERKKYEHAVKEIQEKVSILLEKALEQEAGGITKQEEVRKYWSELQQAHVAQAYADHLTRCQRLTQETSDRLFSCYTEVREDSNTGIAIDKLEKPLSQFDAVTYNSILNLTAKVHAAMADLQYEKPENRDDCASKWQTAFHTECLTEKQKIEEKFQFIQQYFQQTSTKEDIKHYLNEITNNKFHQMNVLLVIGSDTAILDAARAAKFASIADRSNESVLRSAEFRVMHERYLKFSTLFGKLSKLLALTRKKIADGPQEVIAEQAKATATILEQFNRLLLSCCRLSYRAVKFELISEVQQLELLVGSIWSMIRKADHTLKDVETRLQAPKARLPPLPHPTRALQASGPSREPSPNDAPSTSQDGPPEMFHQTEFHVSSELKMYAGVMPRFVSMMADISFAQLNHGHVSRSHII